MAMPSSAKLPSVGLRPPRSHMRVEVVVPNRHRYINGGFKVWYPPIYELLPYRVILESILARELIQRLARARTKILMYLPTRGLSKILGMTRAPARAVLLMLHELCRCTKNDTDT